MTVDRTVENAHSRPVSDLAHSCMISRPRWSDLSGVTPARALALALASALSACQLAAPADPTSSGDGSTSSSSTSSSAPLTTGSPTISVDGSDSTETGSSSTTNATTTWTMGETTATEALTGTAETSTGTSTISTSSTSESEGTSTDPAPACGDGEIDDGEECDDGNAQRGDGCDEDCVWEPWQHEGVAHDVPVADLHGWKKCWDDDYSGAGKRPVGTIAASCTKVELLIACRPIESDTLTLAAHAPREDVMHPVNYTAGERHEANGVAWYWAPKYDDGDRIGFGPAGPTTKCGSPGEDGHLCWTTNLGLFSFGGRCGAKLGFTDREAATWQRVVYQRD